MGHTVREDRGTLVVSLQGDIDLDSSPAARSVLLESVGTGQPVLVDLAGVPYMDSSGVASLVEAYQSARQSQGFFGLAAATPGVLRVLELARLDQVFNVFAGVEEGIVAAS